MIRPTILVDVDGVLADFATGGCRWARVLGAPDSLTPATLGNYRIESYVPATARKKWWTRVTARGFCLSLKPMPGALEAVMELRRLGDVVALTAPMDSPHWSYERMEWLRDHFDFARENVISTSGKRWVPGQFFADDTIDQLQDWTDRWGSRGGAFLIDAPYNEGQLWPRGRGTLADFVAHVRSYIGAQREHASWLDGR